MAFMPSYSGSSLAAKARALQAKGAARADKVARRVAAEARRQSCPKVPRLLLSLRGYNSNLYAKLRIEIRPTRQKHIF